MRKIFKLNQTLRELECRYRLFLSLSISAALHALVIITFGGGVATGPTPASSITIVSRLVDIDAAAADITDGSQAITPLPHLLEAIPPPQPSPAKENLPAFGSNEDQSGDKQVIASPLSASNYFLARELDVRPAIRTLVDVEVPGLKNLPEGGMIRLSLWINEQGGVDSATVDATTLPDDIAERVRFEFAKAAFFPAEKDGRPVRSLKKIEVTYPPLAAVNPLKPASIDRRRPK
jgi:protein TonB